MNKRQRKKRGGGRPAIVIHPEVHSGDAVFAGTRVPVLTLLEHLPSPGLAEFHRGYPGVEAWQVRAVLEGWARVASPEEAEALFERARQEYDVSDAGERDRRRARLYAAYAEAAADPEFVADLDALNPRIPDAP